VSDCGVWEVLEEEVCEMMVVEVLVRGVGAFWG